MATFNSFAALERQIIKDMRTAAQRSKDRVADFMSCHQTALMSCL